MNTRHAFPFHRRSILRIATILLFGYALAAAAIQSVAREDAPTFVLNRQSAERFAEKFDAIFNEDLDITDQVFSPYFIGHLPLAPNLDRQGWKDYVTSFRAGVSDLRQETHEVFLAGDYVIMRVTYHGTHDGMLFGVPATGKAVMMTGIGVFRFDDDGLAIENWAELNVAGVMAQIGALPAVTTIDNALQ
jgi:predicted ester cyclase